MVLVDGVRKAYHGTDAVDGVAFEVRRGEIFGILGPNGAGKTTTVECLQGLRHADSGSIRVLGLDPRADVRLLRRRIGSQLQESALPDRIKVWEALDYFATVGPARAGWRDLLEQWGLAEKQNATFASLSGGQRQRLFVALALVNRPELVFLDEMTTGLDPAARRTAWELIARVRDRGCTVVLVTHFMEEAERLCDRVAIMNRGRIVATGSIPALIEAHAPGVTVEFSVDGVDVGWLPTVPHVSGVSRDGARIQVSGDGSVTVHAAAALLSHGLEPTDLVVRRATLEDVFLALVGTHVEEMNGNAEQDLVA